MTQEKKWRFPSNNYGPENGLDTGDVETFKKDPDAALAREICQNSIDAQFGELPTRVEFKLFEVDRDLIPGIDILSKEIEKCYEFKKDSEKEEKPLRVMRNSINKKSIKCLRISDFNTSGLLGVSTNERSLPFYNLTKGSGVSDKQGTSGGSKGIGKFATFVTSTTNTVFYSTKTTNSEKGYIGISKLRSTPFDMNDLELMTYGIGYYGMSEKNLPILEDLDLDPSFKREDEQYGTDVFIIGFNDGQNWKGDIVAKVLDSFMVAILKKRFEVLVEDILINESTVYDIIYNSNLLSDRTKVELRGIKAQFELLSNDTNVQSKELVIGVDSVVTVYVKQYTAKDEKNATKQCVMVRYPYMKIRHKTGYSYLPYSALCIIHDNYLNKKLRAIENPQHTDWEIKRLNEYPEDKKQTRLLKKELEESIESYIEEILRQSTGESTDVEGAGDYLPAQDENEGQGTGENESSDEATLMPIKRINNTNSKTVKSGEDGNSYDFATGSDGDEGGVKQPNGGGDIPNPNPEPEHRPNDNDHGSSIGNEPILKKVALSGMKYKNIVVDKIQGKYDVVFTSLYDENNCELLIKLCGEAADKYPVEIISAKSNGADCIVENGKICNLVIQKGTKYKISCNVNKRELFASEVVLNAYR